MGPFISYPPSFLLQLSYVNIRYMEIPTNIKHFSLNNYIYFKGLERKEIKWCFIFTQI